MSMVLLLVVVGVVLAVCCTVMAVGLLQNKTFRSCGCSSVTFNGETIRCPACPDKDPDAEAALAAPDVATQRSASDG